MPIETGPESIVDSEVIFSMLTQHYVNHFNQSSRTPFATTPLSDVHQSFHCQTALNENVFDGNVDVVINQNKIIENLFTSLEKLPKRAEIKFLF